MMRARGRDVTATLDLIVGTNASETFPLRQLQPAQVHTIAMPTPSFGCPLNAKPERRTLIFPKQLTQEQRDESALHYRCNTDRRTYFSKVNIW